MQTIKPLSAVSGLTLADFPACIFAITPDSVGADGKTLTDQVGGVVFTLDGAGLLTNNGDGSFSRDATAGVFSKTFGAMPALASLDGMLVVVGSLTDAQEVSVGDTSGVTGSGIGVKTAGGVAGAGRAAANLHTLPNLVKAGMTGGAMLFAYDNSANTSAVHVRDTVATEYETAAGFAIGTLTGVWGALADLLLVPTSVTLNGIYVLKWKDVPPANELQAATGWMSANPTLGLYPAWKNRI